MRQAAFRSILTIKARENAVKVIEDFEVESGKTKEMAKVLKSLGVLSGWLF